MKLKEISINYKVTALNFLMIIVITALGFVGIHSINRLLKLQELNNDIKLINYHMECDMLHDAIAAGTMSMIMAAASSNDSEYRASLGKGLEEHITKLEENFKKSKTINAEEHIKRMLEDATPNVDRYVAAASAIRNVVEKGGEKAASDAKDIQRKDFDPAFTALEGAFEKISQAILDSSFKVTENAKVDADFGRILIWSASFVALCLGILVMFYIRLKLINPINKLVDLSHNLLAGKILEPLPYLNRRDEIGKVAECFEELRIHIKETNHLKQMIDEMPINIMIADPLNNFKIIYINNASQEAMKKLQDYMTISANNALESTLDAFSEDPASFKKLLSDSRNLPHHSRMRIGPETVDVRISAVYDEKKTYIGVLMCWSIATQGEKLARDFEKSIGSVSTEISCSAGTLEQRAVALQGAIEELSSAAREISVRIHDSLNVVQEAVSKGDDARNHMTQLSTAAENVSSVVTLIRSIAEKTNLLALNASIESARAGEAGKGFAVVANEVKTLANQTANAIIEINDQISDMQSFAQATFETVKQMCDTIVTVNSIATDIASAVEEQRASTSEISRSIGKANGQEDNTSTSVTAMASQLKNASIVLSKECDEFLEKVHRI